MSLVLLEGVTKHVLLPDDTRLDILRGVDLDVAAGDHVSIVGRSGSGKSTLLNILGMLDRPSSGSVSFRERPVGRMGQSRLDRLRGRNVGFVFQQFNLLAGRSALENVAMPLSYASGRAFWSRHRVAAEMLDRVGLSHRLESPPEQLSGGEQQRVAIARALVRRPALILADEPTGALDVETGGAVMTLLDEIASEVDAALVTITHDVHVAARARRHYRLEAGILSPVELDLAFRETALGSIAEAPAGVWGAEARAALAGAEQTAAPGTRVGAAAANAGPDAAAAAP
ncbi:ATP-binding cassette domain-containing protein [Microbacterium ulmi]|uniref:ABC transporter ATP-binding protein n=1 Tax=Microbacterium ulmi TaxID=179095 RepID=A0A7Y2M3B5_9MICO|nr:putative ABC transport system ATP-binding protein [Microbacterium ulmi]NNH04989.1 ABC transporter ATP-binding protein [Microbacterium ulmi]